MNMRKTTPVALGLSVFLLFTGCADKGTLGQLSADEDHSNDDSTQTEISAADMEVELLPISIVRDTFNEEIEALRTEKFDNISFENLKTYSFPDVSEITTYKITRYESSNGLSSEQFFENFVTYCNYFEPGKLSKEEIAEETIVLTNLGWDIQYNYNQFQELNKDDDLRIEYISLEISDLYLAYFGQGPYWYIDDALINRYKNDAELPPRSPMSVDMIDDDHPIVYYTENTDSTDVYPLIDGEISIADAAKKANALLAKMAEQCDDDMYERSVCAVKVVDIGEGCFGYYFTVTPIVDGIRYAFADTRSDDGGGYFFTEQYGYGSGSGDYAVMIESGKLHSFTNSGDWKEKTPIDVHDSIVPLKTAAENAAKLLSGEMNFKAKSVTLVYDLKGDSDDLVPCWRFVLENALSREKYYHVYVNAITGEARVKAIQEVRSGYEYD